MTDNEIFDRIVAFANKNMPKIVEQNEEITMDTPINIDGFESLNFIMLICEIEKNFEINIPDRTWNKLRTVGDVVQVVQKALKKKEHGKNL